LYYLFLYGMRFSEPFGSYWIQI